MRALGAHEPVQPGDLEAEHLAVEKQQRAQRLVLGGSRHLAVDGERGEEARELGRSHLGGVTLAVEQDVATDPGDVRVPVRWL